MSRFFATRVYTVPGAPRPFYHECDAQGWCDDNGVDRALVERFDSKPEYHRWLSLLERERRGEISGLRRQVTYELVPDQYEDVQAGEREVAVWCVGIDEFATKAEAVECCKAYGVPRSSITKRVDRVPRVRRRLAERRIEYTADFVYTLSNGVEVVEDVKSEYTRKEKDYIIRRKLMLWRYGIKIIEVIA